jgi:hypothetical protein
VRHRDRDVLHQRRGGPDLAAGLPTCRADQEESWTSRSEIPTTSRCSTWRTWWARS